MTKVLAAALTLLLFSAISSLARDSKPTIVLVHGAFADASSWNGVIERLEQRGFTVRAVANPLRGLKSDGDYTARIIASISGPVVLVGHSYGGLVITEATDRAKNVSALVFVAAFAPEVGESATDLSGKFPGSTLGSALAEPVRLEDGVKDLYIDQQRFHAQFAADVSASEAKLMAATQRPVTDAALNEASNSASWKKKPSWFIYGDADKNIPAEALKWMAKRANAKEAVVIKGGSHVVMVSHPDKVAELIEHAATLD